MGLCHLPGTSYNITLKAARGMRHCPTTDMRRRPTSEESKSIGTRASAHPVANAGAVVITLRPSVKMHVYYENYAYFYIDH